MSSTPMVFTTFCPPGAAELPRPPLMPGCSSDPVVTSQ